MYKGEGAKITQLIVHIISIECRLLRAHSDLSTKYQSKGIDLRDKSEISTYT